MKILLSNFLSFSFKLHLVLNVGRSNAAAGALIANLIDTGNHTEGRENLNSVINSNRIFINKLAILQPVMNCNGRSVFDVEIFGLVSTTVTK